MKMLFIIVLLFSSTVWSAEAELRVGAAAQEQFRYDVQSNGLKISFFKTGSDKEMSVRLRHTLSDSSKFHIQLARANGKVITLELLLAVLSVGNAEQDVQVYAPVKPAELILSQKVDPMCSLKNFGDFYWDSPQDLVEKLRLRQRGDVAVLEIAVQSDKSKPAQFRDSGCSIQLLKN